MGGRIARAGAEEEENYLLNFGIYVCIAYNSRPAATRGPRLQAFEIYSMMEWTNVTDWAEVRASRSDYNSSEVP